MLARPTPMHEVDRPRGRMLHLVLIAAILQACATVPSGEPSSAPPGSGEATISPIETSTPGTSPSTDPTDPPSSSGTHHLTCEDPATWPPAPHSLDCQVSFTLAGDDVPLWSTTVRGPCWPQATGWDMAVFIGCDTDTGSEVHGIDRSGHEFLDWPIAVPGELVDLHWNDFEFGCGHYSSSIVASERDRTIYIATAAEGRIDVHAFLGDTRPRAGWPQPLPGDPGSRCAGFSVADDGSVRMWGYENVVDEDEFGLGYYPFATRTVYSALSSAGETLAGWPVGSTGAASGPLVDADGTTYYVSATSKVWAHDGDGTIKPGWPFQLPEQTRPYLTPDGRLLFVLSNSALALTADGTVAPGWPYEPPTARQEACLSEMDVDCFGLARPAFADDGTLYLALEPSASDRGSTIVALDAHGEMRPGWPYELPDDTYAVGLETANDRHLLVYIGACQGTDCTWTSDTLRLTTDGQPVD